MTPTTSTRETETHLVGARPLLPRLTSVRAVGGARLTVTFETGETRDLDLSTILGRGAFSSLTEPEAFAAVSIVEGGGGIEWPAGADLCVDTLYPADGPYALTS